MTYVDRFVASVSTKNKDIYKTHAEKAAIVFKEYDALKLIKSIMGRPHGRGGRSFRPSLADRHTCGTCRSK